MNLLVNLFYLFLLLIGWICYHIPFFVRVFIAEVISRLWFYLLPLKKRIVLHNLSVVFTRTQQESMQEFKTRCEEMGLAHFRHLILCLFEIFERAHWNEKIFAQNVEIENLGEIRKLQQSGEGFFFLTAHLGNWELITRAGLFLKLKLAIITKALRNPFFNQIWVRSRKRYGLNLLEEEGSGLQSIKAIRGGAAVGFILDQHTGEPHGLEATFFGRAAWCPKGLAILSTRLKAPVITAYMVRIANGRFKLIFDRPLDFSFLEKNPSFWDSKKHLNEAGQKAHIEFCNRAMEKRILEYPEQYLWVHRRFKTWLDYKSALPWEM